MRLDLGGLEAASREALMSEWRAVVGRPPRKHLSRPLIVQILSHAYRLELVGNIPSDWVAGSRVQRGAMWFAPPSNAGAALYGRIIESPRWLMSVMAGAL